MNDREDSREYAIVLVGATGFTGELVARWFALHSPTDLKWAIAGRSNTKLEQVGAKLRILSRDRIPPDNILVDSMISDQCNALVKRAKVVVTTVGPYSLYGEQLLSACARHGTHYCDLTGEIPFVKAMLSKYEADAMRTGSVIINCAGFDSIPVDICNYAVTKYIRREYKSGTRNARTIITKLRGQVSGGTLASVLNLLDVYSLREISEAHAPWSLSATKGSPQQSNIPHSIYDKESQYWLASHIGDSVDRSVAARSASLALEFDWGKDWTTYGYIAFVSRWKAYSYLALLYLGTTLLGLSPVRYFTKKFVIQPGSGPSREEMDSGYLELQCIAESDSDPSRRAITTFEIKKADPGYSGTAIMLGCVAMSLASDLKKTAIGKNGKGGFFTPACLGESLIERLQDAGISIETSAL